MQPKPVNPHKALRAGLLDIYARVPVFEQLPDYQAYLSQYRLLPSRAEGGYSLAWNYPIPPAFYYDRALPSYIGQLLQSQSPYACGGPRRSAPCPPPVFAPRPADPHQPSPQVQPSPVEQRTRVNYPASQDLASRLLGTPGQIAALATLHPVPTENHDSLHFQRLGAHFILERDTSLRYYIDTGRFLRTYTSGESREVLAMAQVSQILRQEHPDRWGRLSQLLNVLPYDQHLFGPPARPPRPDRPTPAVPLPAFQPISVKPPPPPAPVSAPVSQPVQPAPPPVPAPPPAPAPAPVPAPPPAPVPVPTAALPATPAGPVAPFQLKVHRYWDVPAGDFSEVQEVLIQGSESSARYQPAGNNEKQPCFVVSTTLPLDKSVRVTVTWANGQTRVWEERASDPAGSAHEVYSPLG